MAKSVVMPALEMAQETGRLVAWRKREGEPVLKGELLMEVETDKAVVEVEAETDGILTHVTAQEGDVISVGQTIAWIVAPGEPVPAREESHATGRAVAESAAVVPAERTPVTAQVESTERPLASPRARRLAAERGLALEALKGSGPGGAVRAADIAGGDAPRPDAPGPIWRRMAERVTASWTSAPQFFVSRAVDAGALIELRARLASRPDPLTTDLTYTDLLVALAARVLPPHRRVNASWVDNTVRYHEAVNIGLAVAVDQGVVAPVIANADRLSLGQIADRRRELVDRARAGTLRPGDVANGTFTISNLGMYGVDRFTAIVNAPQAAILAVGRIGERVVARESRPVVRSQMTLTLSCDHRVVDGARAAEFLDHLAEALEQPEQVLHDAF